MWCREAESDCRHIDFQSIALPLSYLGAIPDFTLSVFNVQKWALRDSNPRPTGCKPVALPLCQVPKMVDPGRVELPIPPCHGGVLPLYYGPNKH